MKLSTNGQKLRKKLAESHDLKYVNLYFYAVIEGCDTSFFPTQFDVKRKDLITEDISWVPDWLKLWPKRGKTGLNYDVSAQLPQCKLRMTKLLKELDEHGIEDITVEKIFEATSRYLKHQEEKEWLYTKKAHKFILDNDGSVLAEWLQKESPVKKQFYL